MTEQPAGNVQCLCKLNLSESGVFTQGGDTLPSSVIKRCSSLLIDAAIVDEPCAGKVLMAIIYLLFYISLL
ncbi:hypothetical protein [Dickeya aquatica]|uniref:Uncharacterized protein n=1 Tax=Dickeya aquatica TaxID=1401087 RepID=A0A375AB95_9GAMM|nr:hypothetical protein DAQ1742_02356 [Dickeya aquatica]